MQHFNLLDYTNGIMRSLNISFNHDILIDIYEMLFSPNFDGEIPSNKTLVSFSGGAWSVDITLKKIIEISERQLNKIRSVDDLKQAISGLICRSYFFIDAGRPFDCLHFLLSSLFVFFLPFRSRKSIRKLLLNFSIKLKCDLIRLIFDIDKSCLIRLDLT